MNNATLKKSFWKSCTFVALVVCAVTLLLLIGAFTFPTPPLIISEDTTRITGPLTAKGRIDFLKALEQHITPPELATDENGYRLFVRQFGDLAEYYTGIGVENREFYRLQIYEKLGLDPDIPPTLTLPEHPFAVLKTYYETTENAIPEHYLDSRAELSAEILEELWNSPWTLDDFPMLADWTAEIDEPLDAIAAAIAKPVFFVPLVQYQVSRQTDTTPIAYPSIGNSLLFRRIMRMFSIRATYRIGQGNIDGFINDRLTLYRLGRLTEQTGLTCYLAAAGIQMTALALPIEENPAHPLTKEQICRLLEELDALPPQTTLQKLYEVDRFWVLSLVQDLQYSTPSNLTDWVCLGGSELLFEITRYSCDWNIVYRQINEVYDILKEPHTGEKLRARLEKAERPWRLNRLLPMLTSGGRGEIAADYLISLIVSDITPENSICRAQCSENLQRLVLAMMLYQLENGTLPDENWPSQITPYLGAEPEQYFSCSIHPSPAGETRYALVQYGETIQADSDAFWLVATTTSVPFDKAVISADELMVMDRTRIDRKNYFHTAGRIMDLSGMLAAHRNGAVRWHPWQHITGTGSNGDPESSEQSEQ